ncbi:MAG: NAD(P)/FAD-dependent oxidoreductase [Gemmatimonadales bacterium]|jgi:NADH dehydrogenase
MTPHRIVIVGGGFGGLNAAKRLRRAPAQVTLLDRRNFHVFQPLLYQVATGGLSPGDITTALRWILRRQRNTRVWLAQVTDLDVQGRRVILEDGEAPYDTLIVATGAGHHYFGNDAWAERAPGLKTVEDATEIRSRVLAAFEAAERDPDPRRRAAHLTFVIVGGGPTGVELAGAVAELAHHTLRRDFRTIDPTTARILLVEGTDRVLPTYPPSLSRRAERSLARLGVTVLTGSMVRDIGDDTVTVGRGDERETVHAGTVLWAAGVKASPLGPLLADRAGASLDRIGRVIVEPDLTVPGHPEVFVIGDLAHFAHQTGKPLPGIAPVAMSQGRYVARVVRRRLRRKPIEPYRYLDKGQLATIGRAAAVCDVRFLRLWGYPAWLVWLFVHLMYLVGFENRVLVFVQWAWSYVTRNRGTRLIAHGWD